MTPADEVSPCYSEHEEGDGDAEDGTYDEGRLWMGWRVGWFGD